MSTAAVSELKTSLSSFLARVKAGEEVVVTDRGTPIVKIVPIGRDDLPWSPHLLNLQKVGQARVGRARLPAGFWRLPRAKDRKGAALKALQAEREENR